MRLGMISVEIETFCGGCLFTFEACMVDDHWEVGEPISRTFA